MSSPTVVGTPAETAITSAGTSHVVNLPAGATGNLLIAILDKGSTAATVNALTGWTELLDENSANGLYIAYRVCDGSEGATTTFTLSASTRGAWIVYEITGHVAPATQAPQVGTTATGSGTTPNPPSVSVTGGSKDILTIACFGRDGEEADDDTWVTAAPSGFGSLLQKACGTAGTNLGGMIATAHLGSTTATSDPGTFTCATGGWRAQTIVIHPPQSKAQVSWAELEVPQVSSTPKAGTDSGSGADASAEKAALPRTESATGVDASAERFLTTRTETGAGVDSSFLRQQKAASDTGAGADVSAEKAVYARTESGAGADSIKAKASAVAQTGAGTEVSSEHAAYALTQAGTGTETSRLTVPKAVSDTGAGTDVSAEHASYAVTQVSTGADASAEHAAYTVTQPGTGTDASAVARRYAVTDTGAGSDASVEKAVYARAETGAGADSSALQAGNTRNVSDSGTGADSSVLVARVTRTDAGTGADSSSLNQGVVSKAGSDVGSGADSSTLRASLSRSEAGACSDLAALHASLSRTDAGAGTEVSRRAFRTVDTGVGSSASLTRALLAVSQPASALDVSALMFLFSQRTDAGSGFDHALVFKGGLPPDRMGAAIDSSRPTSSVGLNRGGEGSTIEGDREEAEVS